jgi:hypothetical protein
MKNKTLIVTALIILSGCSTPHKVRKYNRAKENLLKSGLTIPIDTVTITSTDTITEILTSNDTTYITKTVTKNITLEPIVEYKTRWQVRTEYKERIKYIKEETKQEKEKTKQVKAENRKSNWWKWLLLGLVVGYLINVILAIKSVSNKIYKHD